MLHKKNPKVQFEVKKVQFSKTRKTNKRMEMINYFYIFGSYLMDLLILAIWDAFTKFYRFIIYNTAIVIFVLFFTVIFKNKIESVVCLFAMFEG